MKMVIAYIQPFMSDAVEAALHRIGELSGATFTDVRGFGRGGHADAPASEGVLGTVPKVRVPAALEDEVVRAIEHAARTGNRGDGKVVVVAVSRALRIATGDEGETAV